MTTGRSLVENGADAGMLAEIEFLDALCAYAGSDVSIMIAGFGRALLAVITSTVSPFLSCVRSGTSS